MLSVYQISLRIAILLVGVARRGHMYQGAQVACGVLPRREIRRVGAPCGLAVAARQPHRETHHNKEKCRLNLMHDNFAHALIAARVADTEQRRVGQRVVRARRLSRKAAKASERAQRLSRQAAQARRQVRVASVRAS